MVLIAIFKSTAPQFKHPGENTVQGRAILKFLDWKHTLTRQTVFPLPFNNVKQISDLTSNSNEANFSRMGTNLCTN